MQPVLVRLGFLPLFLLTSCSALLLYLAYRYHVHKFRSSGHKPDERDQLRITSLKSLSTTMGILTAAVVAGFRNLNAPGGRITIGAYGFLLAVAFFAGVYLAQRRGRREGFTDKDISILSIGIIAAALIGSKLFFYIFEKPPASFKEILTPWRGGLVIYGGIITAAICSWFIIRRRKLSPGKIFDTFTPSIALGIFFGRIGCFLAGCCYGNATTAFTGIHFPVKAKVYSHLLRIIHNPENYEAAWSGIPELYRPILANSPDSPLMQVFSQSPLAPLQQHLVNHQCYTVPVHPSQLYSSFSGLVAFIALSFLYRKRKFEGEVFLWFIMYYSVSRFLLETTRIDTPRELFLGLFSLSQALGVLLFPAALICTLLLRKRAEKRVHHG